MNLTHMLNEYSVSPSSQTPAWWIDQVNQDFPLLRIDADGSEFVGSYRGAATYELQISDIATSRHLVEHPAQRTEENRELFKISYQLSGTGTLRQGQQDLHLEPGCITLYDASKPYQINFDSDMRFIVATFPKSSLDLPPGTVGELMAHRLDVLDATTQSLAVLLGQLAENLGLLPTAAGDRLGAVALNLIDSLIRNRLEIADGDISAEIRRDATEFINANLAHPELSPKLIASALYISPRKLHSVFENSGTTVAKWIQDRRLSELRRALVLPAHASTHIREIAGKYGFEDMSLCSKRFKERYRSTPTEYRELRLQHESRTPVR